MYCKSSQKVNSTKFKLLAKRLRALSTQEIAALFRVSRPTIYSWLRKGIPGGNQNALHHYDTIMASLDRVSVQEFLEGRDIAMETNPTHSRRCLVIAPQGGGKVARCSQRSGSVMGVCLEHLAEIDAGASFLLTTGVMSGKPSRVINGYLGKRCNGGAVNGRHCNTVAFRGESLCEYHAKKEHHGAMHSG